MTKQYTRFAFTLNTSEINVQNNYDELRYKKAIQKQHLRFDFLFHFSAP